LPKNDAEVNVDQLIINQNKMTESNTVDLKSPAEHLEMLKKHGK